MPLVSIVTPTMNQARFIEDTIRSVHDQTYPNVEHIIIDGGSTDGTLEVLERHRGNERLRWISEPDGGMYAAVNKGMRMAAGSIVAYLNSDDAYFPWSVAAAVEFLEHRHEVDLVYGDAVNINDRTAAEHLRIQPPFRAARVLDAWSIPQPAAFWRRELMSTIGFFDDSLQCAGDAEFFLRAGVHGHVAKLDEVLAIERLHDATKSVRWAEQAERERAILRVRYAAKASRARRLGRLEGVVARRAYWAKYLAAHAGLPGATGWRNFIRAGRPHLVLPRLLIGFVPGVPLVWKEGSVTVARTWIRTEADRATAEQGRA